MSENTTEKPKPNLFDIRNIIGALLGIYGVVLVIMSFATSDRQLAKVSGVNANLWVGIGLLAFAIFFIVWATLRPLVVDEKQLEEDKKAVEEEAHRRLRRGSDRLTQLAAEPAISASSSSCQANARRGARREVGTGEQGLDPGGVALGQVRVEVAQSEVVAGRAVHDPQQPHHAG